MTTDHGGAAEGRDRKGALVHLPTPAQAPTRHTLDTLDTLDTPLSGFRAKPFTHPRVDFAPSSAVSVVVERCLHCYQHGRHICTRTETVLEQGVERGHNHAWHTLTCESALPQRWLTSRAKGFSKPSTFNMKSHQAKPDFAPEALFVCRGKLLGGSVDSAPKRGCVPPPPSLSGSSSCPLRGEGVKFDPRGVLGRT